jgi:hypothetical protein
MGSKFLLLIPIFFVTLLTGSSFASGQGMFELDRKGSIRAHVVNAPLRDVMKNFCSTFNLEIKGMAGFDETISLTITEGTFDETLKRLLRGYNYVFMQDATSGKPAVLILGKAERTKYVDTPPPTRAAAEPSPSPTPPAPIQQNMASALPVALVPVQGATSSPKTAATDQQRQQEEERQGAMTASARPTRIPMQSATIPPAPTRIPMQSATIPPAPPQVSGLEMPPMPPSIEEAKAANTQGENFSALASVETPPEIPASGDTTQQKSRPKVDLRDLAPPPIPF